MTSHGAVGVSARPSVIYNVLVSDVMTPRVITIGPDATLFDALVLMRTNNVSGLPVIGRDGGVVGVISQRDLARVLAGTGQFPEIKNLFDVLMTALVDQPVTALQQLRLGLEETLVHEGMSSPPYTIAPDAAVELAAEVMKENSINRIPVVKAERLVGIVTRHDLIRAMVRGSGEAGSA